MSSNTLLSWIELSRGALYNNLDHLARFAGKSLIAVSVKANAYGHGLEEIVPLLSGHKAVSYLTVHSIEEAALCRRYGWRGKLMLLGPVHKSACDEIARLDIEPVVFTTETVTHLGKLSNKLKQPIRTHLKLETGTNRQGITEKEIPRFAELYRKNPHLGQPYGASMHFANVEDTTNHDYARFQLKTFDRLLKVMARNKIKPTIRHTASSAALILFEESRFELVRPGLAVYGHWPSKETYLTYRLLGGDNSIFRPVLSWKTRITQIKQIPADSFIGYGCTYRTTGPTRLAVLPVGYFDGYDRGLSNRAYVLINGMRSPVRGRVCMNLMMVDLTDIKGVKLGDEVTLIGPDEGETVSVEMLAGWADTVNYEILARLGAPIPRLVVD